MVRTRSAVALLLACPLVAVVACGSDAEKVVPLPAAGTAGRVQYVSDDGGQAGQGAADSGAGTASSEGGVAFSEGGTGATSGSGVGASAGAGGDLNNAGSSGTAAGTSPGTGGGGEGGDNTGGSSVGGGQNGTQTVLTVTTNADVHAISPLIYGVNPSHGVACSDATARFSLCRLGGNPWSTYNWENNASNAGADSMLCSENNAALGASNTPGATVTSLISEAGQNAAAVVTVPTLDYVAADKTSGTPYPTCSGNITKSANYQTTRLRHNQARKGSAFADPPDATDANVSQDEFVNFVKAHAGNTKVVLTLDNQPEIWWQTHIALHPAHTTYEEVVARNTEYAKMLRDNWPTAEITGYGGYGYYAFINLQDAPGRPNVEFLDYYLASMKAESDAAQVRLIDYLDVHWYPEFPNTVEDRVQAPRSLWDPTYIENSWIGGSVGAIRLVPWLRAKIDQYYPGTKVAISSYSYGGGEQISGAIAVADALGVFGREGVSLAAVEPEAGTNTFTRAAFAAYRNYDGAGARFGDQSVRATTTDEARVSVHASTDSKVANRVVIIAINRSPDASAVQLDVQHGTAFSSADVYVVSNATPGPVAAAALTSAGSNRFTTTLPGYSVSVIVPKP